MTELRWGSAVLWALALGLLGASAAHAAVEVKRSNSGVTYSIRVPGGWSRTEGGLLVVGLHGQGGAHDRFMDTLVQAGYLADAVLVTPDAPRNAAWEPQDLGPIADLVREVTGRYRAHRTIAFGYSRGAYFSFALGLEHPDLVHAVIAHSGGLLVPVPDTEAAKAQHFFVIHGDADAVVPVSQSRGAVERLRQAGVRRVEYEEIAGHPHRIHPDASRRGFDWVARTLGPVAAPLDPAEAAARLTAIDDAVRRAELDRAAETFDSLRGVPGRLFSKLARASGKHVASSHEGLAIAAARAAVQLGEAGLAVFKKGLAHDAHAVAAANATCLGEVGGDGAIALLINALRSVERDEEAKVVADAIRQSLTDLTGERFETYREWQRWAATQRR